MPRQQRLLRAGEYYDVIGRGNNRQWLFGDEDNFEYYLEQLNRYALKFSVSLFHYCIMSNHVHLLLRSEDADDAISRLMKGIHMVYARYFKNKRKATGHVFEDRFKSWHINTDAYLLECGRYIERNPVRAKIDGSPGQYAWSSYVFYADGNKPISSLKENPLYESLGSIPHERKTAYRKYVETRRAYETILDQFFFEKIAT